MSNSNKTEFEPTLKGGVGCWCWVLEWWSGGVVLGIYRRLVARVFLTMGPLRCVSFGTIAFLPVLCVVGICVAACSGGDGRVVGRWKPDSAGPHGGAWDRLKPAARERLLANSSKDVYEFKSDGTFVAHLAIYATVPGLAPTALKWKMNGNKVVFTPKSEALYELSSDAHKIHVTDTSETGTVEFDLVRVQ
jgi:hypothetical protein